MCPIGQHTGISSPQLRTTGSHQLPPSSHFPPLMSLIPIHPSVSSCLSLPLSPSSLIVPTLLFSLFNQSSPTSLLPYPPKVASHFPIYLSSPNMSRFANNALLEGEVRVRIGIREQRKIKRRSKAPVNPGHLSTYPPKVASHSPSFLLPPPKSYQPSLSSRPQCISTNHR